MGWKYLEALDGDPIRNPLQYITMNKPGDLAYLYKAIPTSTIQWWAAILSQNP